MADCFATVVAVFHATIEGDVTAGEIMDAFTGGLSPAFKASLVNVTVTVDADAYTGTVESVPVAG